MGLLTLFDKFTFAPFHLVDGGTAGVVYSFRARFGHLGSRPFSATLLQNLHPAHVEAGYVGFTTPGPSPGQGGRLILRCIHAAAAHLEPV